MRLSEFRKEVVEVQKLMDNSSDTQGAIGRILCAVYTKGVRDGAIKGYMVGYRHGESGKSKAGSEDIADGVVAGLARGSAGSNGVGEGRPGK